MVLDPLKKNDQDGLSLETAVSTIALSPLVEAQATRLLPAGFEEVDVTVLKWIAAEVIARRAANPSIYVRDASANLR